MPGTPGLQQAIHLGVCKTQFRGSSAEPIAARLLLSQHVFFFSMNRNHPEMHNMHVLFTASAIK